MHRITSRRPRKPTWCGDSLMDITATGLERTACETTQWMPARLQTTRVHVSRAQTVVSVDRFSDFKTITLRDDDGHQTVIFLSLSQADLVRQALKEV